MHQHCDHALLTQLPFRAWGVLVHPAHSLMQNVTNRVNMGALSESTFGLGISEIFEFRSIGNLGISSRNLGVSVIHLEP
jgi:hypothetical protein